MIKAQGWGVGEDSTMRFSGKMPFAAPLVVLVVAAMLAVPAMSFAAPLTVNLGTTSNFAVLAGTTITNTGPTTVGGSAGGDLGLYPGTAFPGLAQVTYSGSVHLADTVARKAKDDLVTAYNDAASRTGGTAIAGNELAGKTLTTGVYTAGSGVLYLSSGTLTLDAENNPDAVFILQASSGLTIASGTTVRLVNGARYCRVFWVVPSDATLETNSHFVGHIFAMNSIWVRTGATVQGQLLARNGSVTLDHNTIMNGICVVGPAIHVSKKAAPAALKSGPGSVTYTYLVSNSGTVDLTGVSVSDNKLSSVKYVSGDVNGDKLLQPWEIWIYTGTAKLNATTSNTATAKGRTAAGLPVSSTASTRVVVSTVSGGALPKTASPWYNLLLAGIVLTLIGAFGWWSTTRKIHG